MKTKLTLLLSLLVWVHCLPAFAQGTAFTYQGRFNANNAPYTGTVEFQFTLWDATSGGNSVAANNPASLIATVADGLFTATLDFGSNPFNGQPRFLQIDARTTIGAFTTLTPRQPLTPTPYALRAQNLATNGLAAGAYGSAMNFNNAGNSFAGTFNGAVTGNGTGLTNVNAATLGGLSSESYWKATGNPGANPANGAFLGTTDTNALEIRVNGQRALRVEYATNAAPDNGYSPNIVGGYSGNIASNGFVGETIVGGGGLVRPNLVGANFATVVGGQGNAASGFNSIAMGYSSKASGYYSVAMGILSTASGDNSTAIGPGNTASGTSATAMGLNNTASGPVSTAMGNNAKALHQGSFVWGDSTSINDFASTGDDQFCIRAHGGVQLSGETKMFFGSTLSQKIFLYGADWGIGIQSGVQYSRVGAGGGYAWYAGGTHADGSYDPGPGGTRLMSLAASGLYVNNTFVSASDRNVKAGFKPVDSREVLEKVAALPIQRWHYTNDASTPHLGPVAQDFYAAFKVGPDDKHITTVDESGVALAAIQGLNEKVEVGSRRSEDRSRKLEEKLEQKETEIAELKHRLEALEKIIRN